MREAQFERADQLGVFPEVVEVDEAVVAENTDTALVEVYGTELGENAWKHKTETLRRFRMPVVEGGEIEVVVEALEMDAGVGEAVMVLHETTLEDHKGRKSTRDAGNGGMGAADYGYMMGGRVAYSCHTEGNARMMGAVETFEGTYGTAAAGPGMNDHTLALECIEVPKIEFLKSADLECYPYVGV